jgi:hypothetical protein
MHPIEPERDAEDFGPRSQGFEASEKRETAPAGKRLLLSRAQRDFRSDTRWISSGNP